MEQNSSDDALVYFFDSKGQIGAQIAGGVNNATFFGANGGKVGIGTNSPTCKFQVNGTAGGSSSWASCSDRNLKKDIHTLTHASDKVSRLRGVTFEWKDPGKFEPGQQIGMVAQEVMSVLPEAVRKAGPHYSIRYSTVVPLLVEAIKEQQQEIQRLKQDRSEIEVLKREMASLRLALGKQGRR